MRKMNGLMIVLVLMSLLGGVLVAPVAAQDASITCDTDLVLLWYLAERYFSFGAVESNVAASATDPSTVLDLTQFNRGELSPLFDALQTAQDPSTMMLPGSSLTPDFVTNVGAALQMDDTAFGDFMNSMQSQGIVPTALVPAGGAGEGAECAQLRGQLQRFFAAIAFQDVQSGFTSTFGNVNANANTNANTNANANDNNANANVNANDNNANANANANTNTNDNNNANVNTNDNNGGGGNDNNGNVNNNDNDDNGGNDNNSGGGNGGGGNDNNSGSGGGNDNGGNDNNSGGGNSGSG